MLESFIAPEKKEIQQEVDYDSLVKDLYTAETWETFEKKRDEIIMKYKNDRVFDQSDLLIAWIEEGAVDNKNKILENIQTKEELFKLINDFSNKFPIIQTGEMRYHSYLGANCGLLKWTRKPHIALMDSYLSHYNKVIKKNNIEDILHLENKYDLPPEVAQELEMLFFWYFTETFRIEQSTMLQIGCCKKFDEEIKKHPESINTYIQTHYNAFWYYIIRMPSREIQRQQWIHTAQIILDNFDKLDDRSLQFVLTSENNSFLKFYSEELLWKFENIINSNSKLSTSRIKTISDFLFWWSRNYLYDDEKLNKKCKDIKERLIKWQLAQYPTILEKLYFLVELNEYAEVRKLLCWLPPEEYKQFMRTIAKDRYGRIVFRWNTIQEDEGYKDFHTQYIDFYKSEIIPIMLDKDKKRAAEDCPWLWLEYTKPELSFVFKTKQEFMTLKTLNKRNYIRDILNNIGMDLSQEGKTKMLSEFFQCLQRAAENKETARFIDKNWSGRIGWIFGNDAEIINELVKENINLLVTSYPIITTTMVEGYGFPKSAVWEIYKNLASTTPEANLLHSDMFLALLEYTNTNGLLAWDANDIGAISTLASTYYKQINQTNMTHSDTRILGLLNKLSRQYEWIPKPDMSIVKTYFENNKTGSAMRQIYWNYLWNWASSNQKYQLENILWWEQGLWQFKDIILTTFPQRLEKDEFKYDNHVIKNFHVILSKDPWNVYIQSLLAKWIKTETASTVYIDDYKWDDMQGKWSNEFLSVLRALDDRSNDNITKMLQTYKALKIPWDTEDILKYMKHDDAKIRALATSSLDVKQTLEYYEDKNMSIKDFVEMLVRLLEDDTGIVRREALKKVQELTDEQIKIAGTTKAKILNNAVTKENFRTDNLEQTAYNAHEEDVVQAVKSEQYENTNKELWGIISMSNFPSLPSKEDFSNNFMGKSISYEKLQQVDESNVWEEKKETASSKYETFLRQLFKYSSKKMYEFTGMMATGEWNDILSKEEWAQLLSKIQNLSGVTIVENQFTRNNSHQENVLDALGTYNPWTNSIDINIEGIEKKAKKENKNVLYVLADVFLHELIHTADYGVAGETEKKFDKYIVEYPLASSPVDLDEIFTEIFSSMFQIYTSSDEFKKTFEEAGKRWMLPEVFLKELNDSYEFYTDRQEIIGLVMKAPIDKMFAMYIRWDINALKRLIKNVYGTENQLDLIFPKKR